MKRLTSRENLERQLDRLLSKFISEGMSYDEIASVLEDRALNLIKAYENLSNKLYNPAKSLLTKLRNLFRSS